MMEEQLLPQLRFPEFDLGYKRVELKKIATFNPKSEELPESFIYIDLESVKNGLLSKEERINKSEAPSRAQRLLRKDDIIYQTVRPYQKNNYFFDKNANDYVASTGYAQIRTKQVSEYLYQYLHTEKFVNKVLVRCTGTSYPAINSTDLSKISINIPNITEQQKIASFLSDIDDKITKLTKKRDLLEQYKKGIMQKIFSQELRFEDDNGNEFPKWEVKKLGDLGLTLNGLTGKTKENFGSGKPYIQYKQIFDSSKINIKDCGFVEITPSDNQTKMQYGDVFFTTSSETPNEIGTASVLLDEVEEIYLNSFCFGFRVLQTVLYPSFSQFLFRSNNFRKKMIPLAQGSTRYNISKSSFLKLKVFLPSIEEQTKIANFLSDIDAKIEALNNKIENCKAFKKGLLQQMFV